MKKMLYTLFSILVVIWVAFMVSLFLGKEELVIFQHEAFYAGVLIANIVFLVSLAIIFAVVVYKVHLQEVNIRMTEEEYQNKKDFEEFRQRLADENRKKKETETSHAKYKDLMYKCFTDLVERLDDNDSNTMKELNKEVEYLKKKVELLTQLKNEIDH